MRGFYTKFEVLDNLQRVICKVAVTQVSFEVALRFFFLVIQIVFFSHLRNRINTLCFKLTVGNLLYLKHPSFIKKATPELLIILILDTVTSLRITQLNVRALKPYCSDAQVSDFYIQHQYKYLHSSLLHLLCLKGKLKLKQKHILSPLCLEE